MNKNSIKRKDYIFIFVIVCILKIVFFASLLVENYQVGAIRVVLNLLSLAFVVYMFVKNRYSFIKNWELTVVAGAFCITSIYQLIVETFLLDRELFHSYYEVVSSMIVYGPWVKVCDYALLMVSCSVISFKGNRMKKENTELGR